MLPALREDSGVRRAALADAVLALAPTPAVPEGVPVPRGRVELPDRVLLSAGAVVLLVALLATEALTECGEFAGVAVGGVPAWRRAPFAVVVLGAAAATAVLRAAGVP